jgi:hypothetical protein
LICARFSALIFGGIFVCVVSAQTLGMIMKKFVLTAAALSLLAACATPSGQPSAANGSDKPAVPLRDDVRAWLISEELFRMRGGKREYDCSKTDVYDEGGECALSDATWIDGPDPYADEAIRQTCGLTRTAADEEGPAAGGGPLIGLATMALIRPLVQGIVQSVNENVQQALREYSAVYAAQITHDMYHEDGALTTFKWRCLRVTRTQLAASGEVIGAFDFIAKFQAPKAAIGEDTSVTAIDYNTNALIAVRPLRMIVRDPVAKVHEDLYVNVSLRADTHVRADGGGAVKTKDFDDTALFPLGSTTNVFSKDEIECGAPADGAARDCPAATYWIDEDERLFSRPIFVSLPRQGPSALTTFTLEMSEFSKPPSSLEFYASYLDDNYVKGELSGGLEELILQALAGR